MILALPDCTDAQLIEAARWASVEDERLDDFDPADKLSGEDREEIIEKLDDLGYSHWDTIQGEAC